MSPTHADTPPIAHRGVAEQGKVMALEGRHDAALLYYRQAMRLAGEQNVPEIVMRHYAECTMESLELSGAYDAVVECCDRAIAHYDQHPPAHDLTRIDLASHHQRRGTVLAKMGQVEESRRDLQRCIDLARPIGRPMPLAETLMRWQAGGLFVDPKRIEQEQHRLHYFSVRSNTVCRESATPLPAPMLGHGLAAAAPAPSRSRMP